MRHDRSSSIAFLLSVGAIPLGCPAGEEDGSGQTSFATSVGNGASTNPSSGSGESEGTGTDGPMSTTDATDSTDASASMSTSTTVSTTEMTTTMSTTEPATDPSLTDPSGITEADTGYGTYGSGGQFMCTGAVQSQACGSYAAKVTECYPKYAGMEGEIAYNCNCSIEYYNTYYGPACGGAIEDFYACLASTSCQELAGGMACAAADMNVIQTCGFGG